MERSTGGRLGGARWVFVVVIAALVGCEDTLTVIGPEDSGAMTSDAGPIPEGQDPTSRDGGVPQVALAAVAPPDISWLEAGEPAVALPAFTPCPAGWAEVNDLDHPGVVSCEPWSLGESLDCPAGEAHLVGEAGCVTVGAACPAGDFAGDLPTTGTRVYVRETAPAGGDGSLASPYATLAEVPWGALAADTVVALGKGRYEGNLTLAGAVTLWGACAAQTELAATTAGPEPVVDVTGAGVVLRNLRIGASPRPGITVSGTGAGAELHGVALDSVTCHGILAEGEVTFRAEGLIVRDTGLCADGTGGRGLELSAGPNAEVRRALFARNRGAAIWMESDSAATDLLLEDAVLRQTQSIDVEPGWDPNEGTGLVVIVPPGADATVEARVNRALFETNAFAAAWVAGLGARFELDGAVMRDSRAVIEGAGAEFEARRSRFGEFWTTGVLGNVIEVASFGDRNRVLLEDVVVADSKFQGFLALKSSVEIRRAVFARNEGDLDLFGSYAVVEDVLLGLASGAAQDSAALVAQSFSHPALPPSLWAEEFSLDLRRMIAERMPGGGLALSGELGTAVVEDVVVRENRNEVISSALWLGPGRFTVRRTLLEHNCGVAILAFGPGERLLENTVIRDTESLESSGLGGRALQAHGPITMRRTVMERSHDVAVYASTPSSDVRLEDLRLESVRARGCADDEASCVPAGHGLGVYQGGSLDVERFVLRDMDLCGMQIAEDSQLELHDGSVSDALVGACVQVDDYDIGRLSDNVRYSDNGTNMQATRLPVPDPL